MSRCLHACSLCLCVAEFVVALPRVAQVRRNTTDATATATHNTKMGHRTELDTFKYMHVRTYVRTQPAGGRDTVHTV